MQDSQCPAKAKVICSVDLKILPFLLQCFAARVMRTCTSTQIWTLNLDGQKKHEFHTSSASFLVCLPFHITLKSGHCFCSTAINAMSLGRLPGHREFQGENPVILCFSEICTFKIYIGAFDP